MLIAVYNIAQFAALVLAWPFLVLYFLFSGRGRRLPARLGAGLAAPQDNKKQAAPTFWLHALSVGEITSAVSLVAGLRQRYPEGRIFITVTTATGHEVARKLIGHQADQIFAAPFDLLPVVNHFIRRIKPDLFILVETDYWPNLLAALDRRRIPMLLVNGRMSQKSFVAYSRHRWFFRPMFCRFERMCVQTEQEKTKFHQLGVDGQKLFTLGNLKYDLKPPTVSAMSPLASMIPDNSWVITAGSTHRGEETLILKAYHELRAQYPKLFLVLVPRRPERAEEILGIAATMGLAGHRRSEHPENPGDLLLVDTIGELLYCYLHSHLAFVGGSMVAAGGHNPIEPASLGLPVLFGPHMEDFQEISTTLLVGGGAKVISDHQELAAVIRTLITNEEDRQQIGRRAQKAVEAGRGVVERHLELIHHILN